MDLQTFYNEVLNTLNKTYTTEEGKKHAALTLNFAEAAAGQQLLQKCLPNVMHLCWPRAGPWPNAVYLCPWPYRPTAVVRGSLEPFAKELFEREGIKLDGETVHLMN
jgi:hypothetical protein